MYLVQSKKLNSEYNIAIGGSALASIFTGCYNTAYGYTAFESRKNRRIKKINRIINNIYKK